MQLDILPNIGAPSSFFWMDGRFPEREQIEDAIHAAEQTGCKWRIILAACPDEIAEARLMADLGKHPATNRTVELYREVKAQL